MNKKILISLSVIAAVAAIAIGVTMAFFSDTENSTGNTFTAGELDLRFQYEGGVPGPWTDVNGAPLFGGTTFPLDDLKPGDKGEKTVRLWVDDNPACGKFSVIVTEDKDNTCTEPELLDEPGCTATGYGELNDAVNFAVWEDMSTNGKCNNILDNDEHILVSGPISGTKAYSIGELPLTEANAKCYGVAYCFGTWNGTACNGALVNNASQSDSFKADLIIEALQKRNQFPGDCPVGDFVTSQQKTLVLENKTAGWQVIGGDNIQGTLTYNTAGDTFNYSFIASGLQHDTNYSLVYYADQQTRFTNWGGANPGALIATFTTDVAGAIPATPGNINLGMDLPTANDWNMVAFPDYCLNHNGFDSYNTCVGAKIWLVPTSDYNSTTKLLTTWNPANYLFETDLITYDDTNI
jgi:predicted ribosomally synthesized peptide with SipW-like signal peptide